MSNDLSDWTEPPDAVKGSLTAAGLGAIGAIPVAGAPLTAAIDAAVSHRHEKWLREGFSRVAARLRALEEAGTGPSVQDVLDSDEFIAACAAVSQDLQRTASEEKRRRLADVLTKMGPWGPEDAETRRQFFSYVESYDEPHMLMLDFFADPVGWIRRGTPAYDPASYMAGGVATLLTSYMFPADPGWQERLGPVLAQLQSDGLIESPGLNTTMTSQGMHASRLTRRGRRFLRFIRADDEIESER